MIREKVFGSDYFEVAGTLANLGRVYEKQGKYGKAEAFYKRALAINQGYSIISDLAQLYHAQGRYSDEEGLLNRVLAFDERAFGANHPETAGTLNQFAELYHALGKSDRALDYSRRATAALLAHASGEAMRINRQDQSQGLIGQRAHYFIRHVANLAAASKGRDPGQHLAARHWNFPNGQIILPLERHSSRWHCDLLRAVVRSQCWCASARTSPPCGASATRR